MADRAQPTPYSFPDRVLRKWSSLHLTMDFRTPQDSVSARFDYEGATCNNMGTPLRFLFEVELSLESFGYLVRSSNCRKPERGAWRKMCSSLTDPSFLSRLESEHPFQGRPLEEAVAWRPLVNPAGCLCSDNNRNHKWQIVFQTIHYALTRKDQA